MVGVTPLLVWSHLANGLNVHEGQITNAAVARDLGYAYRPVSEVLA